MVDERDIAAAHATMALLGMRCDNPTAAAVARVMCAIRAQTIELPVLPHSAAGKLGERLAGKWVSLVGTPAPESDDLVWADLVQFVLHAAREQVREALREGSSI